MLAQFYPPIIGGIERHVQSLSSALAKRGHSIAVATLWHPGQPECELDGVVRIYRVRGTMQRIGSLFTTDRQHSPPFPDPEVMLSLRSVIEKEQPDVVHAHNWMLHSFLPIKSWSKAKLVMTLHDSEMSCVQMRMMYMDKELCSGPGVRKCLKCAGHHYGTLKGSITLLGDWLMNGFEKTGVDLFLPVSNAVARANGLMASQKVKEKVQIIPNFIPDHVAPKLTEDAHLPETLPKEPFILQVGDLVPDKGIYILLEAYQQLQPAPPLVLIGRRTADSPTELPTNVTVLDSLPHDEVMQAWQHCLFGTVSSLCLDASPTVTLEAMACGRPVVGSAIGGITDQIIDKKTGFLIPPGNVEALSSAMQLLINDSELRSRMGTAALERVAEFQASSVVNQIEMAYRSL